MRDLHISNLRIYCQNVNRNYALLDSVLASRSDEFDLLFVQEPPWNLIRHAPSAATRAGEAVVGAPINPDWGCIVRAVDRGGSVVDPNPAAGIIHPDCDK
jgi:hypothetical protein